MTVITAKDCDKDYKMDKAYSGRDAKLGSSLSNVHQNIDAAKGYVVMLSEGDSVIAKYTWFNGFTTIQIDKTLNVMMLTAEKK